MTVCRVVPCHPFGVPPPHHVPAQGLTPLPVMLSPRRGLGRARHVGICVPLIDRIELTFQN